MKLKLININLITKNIITNFAAITPGQGRSASYKDRLQMPYTEAVLLESLRISNIGSIGLPHSIDKDIMLNGVVRMHNLTGHTFC